MKVHVSADIPEANAKEHWSGKGPVPGPQENSHAEIKTVWGQGAPRLPPLGGWIRRRSKEMVHMFERGIINPVQHYKLGAEVQLFHLGATQIQDLGCGRKLPVQDQGQTDVLDPTLWKVSLVNTPVLDYSPR
jgi:hypothetical protein